MIDILLSTYNGTKYLQEQIDSLLNQSFTDWNLLIRDDGSIDNTLDIIDDYCQKYPDKIKKLSDTNGNVGVIRSFEILLQHSISDYIMFCDQDDVWLPDKISLSIQKIKQMEQKAGNIPLLVHTDLMVVDKDLKIIAASLWKLGCIRPEILDKNIYYMGMCNSVTGCTLIMNRQAKEKSLPFPKNILMHDAWIALSVMKKGKIDYIVEPTVQYRQHGSNVYGAEEYKFSLKDKLLRIKNTINNNLNLYHKSHPFVYKNFAYFLYHKIKYFCIIHIIK
ncbi:MAG: glycosyltransferase family 2 protein [Prevotellaceae bacterium]|jgi:glycosyltransferase involved in cell wall biosynthesis|nr:glycosyltransferase family 2 protein [Prevotellaceae bacterium]